MQKKHHVHKVVYAHSLPAERERCALAKETEKTDKTGCNNDAQCALNALGPRERAFFYEREREVPMM